MIAIETTGSLLYVGVSWMDRNQWRNVMRPESDRHCDHVSIRLTSLPVDEVDECHKCVCWTLDVDDDTQQHRVVALA